MYTKDEFTYRWQRLHHPSMDVRGDVEFFYHLYCKLHRLVKEDGGRIDEPAIRSWLLYTENTIAIGSDGIYLYRYRSLGGLLDAFSARLKLTIGAANRLQRLMSEAVVEAEYSALRRWIIASVLSHHFPYLSGMLTWFVRADVCLRRVYPDLRFRKAMFRRLTGDRLTARRMRLSDLAFNWQDKRGFSLAAIIADQCRALTVDPLTDPAEQPLLSQVADALATLHSERLDTYTVIDRKDASTLTLRHRDGRVFENVRVNEELTIKSEEPCHLAAQLVTYLGKTYLSGPALWLDSKEVEKWNGERIWTDIIHQEQAAAAQRSFTTAFGRRISLYDDLYTVPEDPEEAYDADWGIYWDEPNIFDFLELFGQQERMRIEN